MKILVTVGRVPENLDARTPWHFFQELEPLANQGHEILVLNEVEPTYRLEGIQIVRLQRPSLKRLGGSEAIRLFRYLRRAKKRFPAIQSPRDLLRSLQICQWNQEVERFISEFQPDVMHSHWAWPQGTAGYLAAEACGIPLVMTLRGHEHIKSQKLGYGSCLDSFFERTFQKALLTADAITVCCSDSRSRLNELGIEDRGQIISVFHAVNETRFNGTDLDASELKQKLGLADRRLVTCVAIIDHQRKGHDTLLMAFHLLASSYPDASLLFVGDGPLKPALEIKARELGIIDRVIFAGSVHPTEVQHYIRMSDVTVLPTFCEVFGNVVFESLVVGVPVVSGNVGAAKDVLPREGIGEVFTPGDEKQCALAISKILDKANDWKQRAMRGRHFVLSQMNIKQRISGFLRAYELAVDSKKRKRNPS